MAPRALMFLSEILSAKSLIPVRHALGASGWDVRVINDGFCHTFLDSEGERYELLGEPFASRVEEPVAWADVVITGKSYIEPSEYLLMDEARRQAKPLALVLPDSGADIVLAKLRDREGTGLIELPETLISDERTRDELIRRGLPPARLIPVGNPYFDEVYESVAAMEPEIDEVDTVVYFATPFDLDWDRGILPTEYPQAIMIEDLRTLCRSLGVRLVAKRHPQVPGELFAGLEVREGSPIDVLRRTTVAVSSYSTTLLEAWTAGVPAVSYQPWAASIRSDVFSGRIAIAKNLAELSAAIQAALVQARRPRPRGRTLTFNPGAAIPAVIDAIERVAARVSIAP